MTHYHDDPVVHRAIRDGRIFHVEFDAEYDSDDPEAWTSPRREVSSVDNANVVSSENSSGIWRGQHRLMLDLDVPAALIPSSTPGHSHLYVEVAAPWDDVVEALKALAKIGVLEWGYVNASIERGFTSLRLPEVKKVVPISVAA